MTTKLEEMFKDKSEEELGQLVIKIMTIALMGPSAFKDEEDGGLTVDIFLVGIEAILESLNNGFVHECVKNARASGEKSDVSGKSGSVESAPSSD